MTTPLFSTYSQGENRVTATFLAVLQRLSLPNIDRILGALLDDQAYGLLTFNNQPKGKSSIPDAKIETGRSIWIETKTELNAVNHTQLENHLQNLGPGEKLLLLTPDYSDPVASHRDEVVWSSFITLSEVVEEILNDTDAPPSENEAFLLRELILMLRVDGLLNPAKDRVLVVAARTAWPMYQQLGVYRCHAGKPMREFRPGDHLAFYAGGAIQAAVPKIQAVVKSINLTNEEETGALNTPDKERAERLLEKVKRHEQLHEFNGQFKILFTTDFGDAETVKLAAPVSNDKLDKNGKTTPFTYGARYVTLESLKEARKTSQLVAC